MSIASPDESVHGIVRLGLNAAVRVSAVLKTSVDSAEPRRTRDAGEIGETIKL